MNITKFTQKSIEAIQNMEKIAYDHGNQMIDQEHFLYALLNQEGSLIAKLITKMGIQLPAFTSAVERIMEGDPKVQGGSPYVSQELNNVLISAEDEAKAMGDDYVSVEHLFLSMIKHPNRSIKQLFKSFGISRESFLQVLSSVRGNQRVTTDSPEDTYESLTKYGRDLVQAARDQKLDPSAPWIQQLLSQTRIISTLETGGPSLKH